MCYTYVTEQNYSFAPCCLNLRLSFPFTSGDVFTLDNQDGVLTVRGDIDRELWPEYQLIVQVHYIHYHIQGAVHWK